MLLAQVVPVSVSIPAVPWYWWVSFGVMVLLQLVILIVIAGRPSAVAVIGVTLPFLCGVCGIAATGIILDYGGGIPPATGRTNPLVPLLYVIWSMCALVALVSVVLSIVTLGRRTVSAASKEPLDPAPARATDAFPRKETQPSSSKPETKVSP